MSKECTHPMMLSNMCAVCGKILDEEYDTKDFSSLTMTGGTVLRVSTNEALSIQQNQTAVLQQSRRLALVLDIDNTLVHATYAKGRAPATHRQHENSKDIYHLPLEETGMDGTRRHLVIKKRPHLDLFLREMHSAFQMTIYTAGTKRYAEAVTRVIDPHGTYIGSRIVARSEDGVTGVHDKSLEKIFLKDSSMAVILDDREDVWRGPQSEQLLVVRPYEFFHPGNEASIAVQACTEMGYVNNAPGMATGAAPSPSSSAGPLVPVIVLQQPRPGMAIGLAQRTSTQYTEADDQLLRCIDLLRSLHQHYYARIDQHQQQQQQQQLQTAPSPSSSSTHTTLSSNSTGLLKPTVAELLRQHRSLILRSCVVAIASDPQMPAHLKHDFSHRMRHLARSLGATVVFDLHPRTTHVIALTDNCPLVREAVTQRAQDVWVLHVDWLHHCRWALAKAEESTFMLRPPAPGAPFPQPKYESSSSPALLSPTASTAAPPTQTGFRAASDGMAMEATEEREGVSGANNGKRKRTHADTHPASAVSTTHITAAAEEKDGKDAINSASATSENGAESEQAHLPKRRKTVSIVETTEGNGDRAASVGRRAPKGGVAGDFDRDDDDEDDKVLREVKRSARLQRLAQERRRQHRMRKAHRDSGDTAANLEEEEDGGGDCDEYGDELFQLDSSMRCGVGEEDEGDGDEDDDEGGVEKMQDDTAASTISKAQKRLLRRSVGTRNEATAKTNEDEELVEDEEEDDDEEVDSDDENGNGSDDSDVNHLNHHMNGNNNIDESERVRYSKFGSNSFQNDGDEDEEDGYFVQSGDDENEDAEEEDEDEEEMALVQKLRSRTAQYPSHLQQDQQPMSDSDSEGFATLQHYGGRSISNSSAALSGMDSYPNSIPASPFAGTTGAAVTSSFENTLTEKVLASIAPGPVVDMDEEEESFMQS